MPPKHGSTNQSSASHSRGRGNSYQPTGASTVPPSSSDNTVSSEYGLFSGSNGPYMMSMDRSGFPIPWRRYPVPQFPPTAAPRQADSQSFNAQYTTGNGPAANPTMGSNNWNLDSNSSQLSHPQLQVSYNGPMGSQFLEQYNSGMSSAGGLDGPDSVLSPGQSTLPPVSPAPSSAYQPHPQTSSRSSRPLTLRCLWNECFKECRSENALMRHVREQHVSPRRFGCPFPLCVERFNRHYKLRDHLSDAHSDNPSVF